MIVVRMFKLKCLSCGTLYYVDFEQSLFCFCFERAICECAIAYRALLTNFELKGECSESIHCAVQSVFKFHPV